MTPGPCVQTLFEAVSGIFWAKFHAEDSPLLDPTGLQTVFLKVFAARFSPQEPLKLVSAMPWLGHLQTIKSWPSRNAMARETQNGRLQLAIFGCSLECNKNN